MSRNNLKSPIQLTRIIAVNWYGFNQVMDVTGNLVITGEYGTGKSALLDLIQRVLLGSHARFNRAATGDASKRLLKGYCLCDTNTGTDAAEQFARDQVVSFIGLEFTWPGGKKRQTWGQRIQFDSPSSRPMQLYFCYPDRLDLAHTCDEKGDFLEEAPYRAWLKREGADVWDREDSYLDNLAHAGNLNFNLKLLLKTLPESLAFQRISRFDEFIRERLLAEAPLQIDEVRRSLEVHEDYAKKLKRFEDQLVYLQRITGFHKEQMDAEKTARIMRALEKEFELSRAIEVREMVEQNLVSLNATAETERRELCEVMSQREAAKIALDAARALLTKEGGDDLLNLRSQEQRLRTDVVTLNHRRTDALSQLRERGTAWQRWIQLGRQLPDGILADILEPRADLLSAVHTGTLDSGIAAMPALAEHFHKVCRKATSEQAGFSNTVTALTREVNALRQDVEKLDKNRTHGDFPLRDYLEKKLPHLPGRFGPEQLCRLTEIKPTEEHWRTALELFLRNNRYALILDPDRHRLAQQLLEKDIDRDTRREPLVDPDEAMKLESRVLPNSLAEKVTASHPVARAYLDHLLGSVICVDSPAQFPGKTRAITETAVLWNRPVTTKLGRECDFDPVIGIKGLETLKQRKLKLLTSKMEELRLAEEASHRLTRWIEGGEGLNLGSSGILSAAEGIALLESKRQEWEAIKLQLEVLAKPELDQRVAEVQKLDTDHTKLSVKEDRLKNSDTAKEIRALEIKHSTAKATENNKRLELEEFLTHHGEGLPKSVREEYATPLLTEFRHWEDRIKRTVELRGDAEKNALSARGQKIRERSLLRQQFPEFSRFNENEDSNADYDSERELLEGQKVGEYRRKADETRKDWEDRLKQHILGALKKRTNQVVLDINQLNASIDEPIGRNRYRLSWEQRKDSDFDLLWNLLRHGFEATDPLTGAIRDPQVEDAKAKLMEALKSPADSPLRQRLDYREYFKFDMKSKDLSLPEDAGWSSLNRHAGKMSGGENQSPFFLAMLAAFLRAYHRAEPGSLSRRDTLGVVAMDEAFSKLSGDGVESCMMTANTLGLQLILAMPDKDAPSALRGANTILMITIDRRMDESGRMVIENWAHPARASDTLAELES